MIVQNETALDGIGGRIADLTVTIAPGEYRSFIIKLAADADYHTSLTYDPYTSMLTLDRSYAGSRADIVHSRSCKVRSQNGAVFMIWPQPNDRECSILHPVQAVL